MKPAILFRKDLATEDEFNEAKNHCDVYEFRSEIPENKLVIGRYSVLPFYQELESELAVKGCRLINSYEQHHYIADITNYYDDIKEYTPKTYTTWANLDSGKWVVKGKTNSRKHEWNRLMFADGREQLLKVIDRLLDDTFIKEQGIVVREYVPLKKVGEGINGLPITREWRCFFINENLIASDFYWSSHDEYYQGQLPDEGKHFAEKVAKIVAKKTNFFVLDVAETEKNDWIVIEINDGQMSGISCISPKTFYSNLRCFTI